MLQALTHSWTMFSPHTNVHEMFEILGVMNTDFHPTFCVDSFCKVNVMIEAAVSNNICYGFYPTLKIQSEFVFPCELLIN